MARKSTAKVLQKTARKGSGEKRTQEDDLKKQYQVIRADLLKLREDLAKGYDMARNYIDRRSSMFGLFRG